VTYPIEIRQAISSDLPDLASLDHDYSTDHVWQMSLSRGSEEISVAFRDVRLPRPMRVHYPRDPRLLADTWTKKAALLIGESDGARLAYLCMIEGMPQDSGWVADLVVDLRHRRRGIATALLGRAMGWCRERGYTSLYMEMQSKNHAAICLARKLGFGFSGFSDQYYPDADIALFYRMPIKERLTDG
jgi:GNAT superfamily N-acetyltransferase